MTNKENVRTLLGELNSLKDEIENISTYTQKYSGYGDMSVNDFKSEVKKIITQHIKENIEDLLLSNANEEIATLQAKIFAYEEIISKSNFAPFINKSKNKEEKANE